MLDSISQAVESGIGQFDVRKPLLRLNYRRSDIWIAVLSLAMVLDTSQSIECQDVFSLFAVFRGCSMASRVSWPAVTSFAQAPALAPARATTHVIVTLPYHSTSTHALSSELFDFLSYRNPSTTSTGLIDFRANTFQWHLPFTVMPACAIAGV